MLLGHFWILLGRTQPLHRLLSVIPVSHVFLWLLEFYLTNLACHPFTGQSHWLTGTKGDGHFFRTTSMEVPYL